MYPVKLRRPAPTVLLFLATLLVLGGGELATPAEQAATPAGQTPTPPVEQAATPAEQAATSSEETTPPEKAKPAGKELGGWRAPKEARAVPNAVKPSPESVARGQATFEKTCLKCHGRQGHGDGKMAKALVAKPADLTLRLPPQSDGEIFWKLTEGKSPMPSFKKDLTPEQRWDVVNFLRQIILASPKTPAKADSAPAKADSAPAKSGGS